MGSSHGPCQFSRHLMKKHRGQKSGWASQPSRLAEIVTSSLITPPLLVWFRAGPSEGRFIRCYDRMGRTSPSAGEAAARQCRRRCPVRLWTIVRLAGGATGLDPRPAAHLVALPLHLQPVQAGPPQPLDLVVEPV